MPEKKTHEILIDLLEADTAIFLADRPTLLELARFIDGLAQVQAALEKIRTIACKEFVDRLERANNEVDESAPHSLGCRAEGAIDLRSISAAREVHRQDR